MSSPTQGRDRRPILYGRAARPRVVTPRGGGSRKVATPSPRRQGERLDSRFAAVEALIGDTVTLATSVSATDPELVVVFEAVDERTDLEGVAQRLGFEVLVETEESLLPDSDFPRLSTRNATDEVGACLHAVCVDQTSVQELLRLWAAWKRDGRLDRGYGPLSDLFAHLKDVRPWGPQDRLRAVDWSDYFDGLIPDLPQDIEIELWYRRTPAVRARVEANVRQLVHDAGGSVLVASDMPEIGYHGLKCMVPVALLRELADGNYEDITIVRSPNVMYLRVTGQQILPADSGPLRGDPDDHPLPEGPPVVCALDGVPVANHRLLSGRVLVHDPDDYAGDATATVSERVHGTMITSVLVWGDRGSGSLPATRPVLVRPILAPSSATVGRAEEPPVHELLPDLMHRVFRELFDDDTPGGPVGTDVVVVNLSVGDPAMQFETIVSSWARALDWLSHRYGVLVVVSAGNHQTLPFEGGASALATLAGDERVRAVNRAMESAAGSRRLLSPAEAINVITVGALHSDHAGPVPLGYRIDPADGRSAISVASANGRGLKRGVKPDLLAPGGRMYCRETAGGSGSDDSLRLADIPAAGPGIRVAAADPDRETFASGTSPAAALISRYAATLHDVLDELEVDVPWSRRRRAVALKTLIGHSTRHPDGVELPAPRSQFAGHGVIVRDLLAGCSANEVTLLFVGALRANEVQDIQLPLPDGLEARGPKRIDATLAWLSPVNWQHRQYRRAALQFNKPTGFIELGTPTDIQTTEGKRGTLQHSVWETDRAVPHGRGDSVTLSVACSEQAGGLDGESVDFAVAVTLWTAPELSVDVYAQVAAQIRPAVPIRPT